jgi:hypothetical protein
MTATRALTSSCIVLAATTLSCGSFSVAWSDEAMVEPSGPYPAGKSSAKVGAELRALYEAYREARQRGLPFHSDNPQWPVVEDRVVIDATAAADAGALETDLIGLGLRHPAAFGRMVSGQLPISAIPALDALRSLAFVRAAARRQSPRSP